MPDPSQDENNTAFRYRRVFESSHDGILILDDPSAKIIDANPRLMEMIGAQREQVVGRPFAEAIPFAHAAMPQRILADVHRCGVAYEEGELKSARFTVPVEMLCNSYREGKSQVIQCNVRDVTKRKRTETALRESEERLRLLVESVRDYAILTFDPEARITSWNPGAELMLGYSDGEVLGRKGDFIFTPEDREARAPEHEFGQARHDGRAEDERWHLRKDGTRLFCSGIMSPLRHEDGRIRGYAKIMRDMTERRQTEQRLQESQRMESVAILAGGVAHDFNNLLSTILGNAALAADDLPRFSPIRQILDDIVQASRRASDLTRQLLAYAGKGRFLIQRVDLSRLVMDQMHLIQASLPKSVHVHLRLDENLPPLETDPSQIHQIVMNLVINAGEAIGEKPGVVTIATGTEEITEHVDGGRLGPGTYVYLEVSDSGRGMDPRTLERMFEPFFTTKFTGRGLGLAAVSGIVRQHGGNIRVTSEPGRGTTFRVLLSAAGQEPPPSAPDAGAPSPIRGEETILLVDDEPDLRRLYKAGLERYGYTVLLAEHGLAALEVFRHRADRIAFIVLDMAMPEMSGDQALPLLKEIRPDVPVLIASGYSEAIAAERFSDGTAPAAGFIQKPFTAEELARRIRDLVGQPESARR